jgi:hypothetical protein
VLKHRKCFCSRNIENAFAAERRVTDGRMHRLTELIYMMIENLMGAPTSVLQNFFAL